VFKKGLQDKCFYSQVFICVGVKSPYSLTMRLKFNVLLISVLITQIVFGQTTGIKGSVQDLNDSTHLSGATITLALSIDTAFKYSTVSSATGAFEFRNIPRGQYILSVSFVGYDKMTRPVTIGDGQLDLGIVAVPKNGGLLSEVIVQGQTPPVKQKNDTLEYNASSFKVNPDANADDMIKKMPGITIEQGAVKAGGEEVKKVTVDGRDFFGDDATAALKNLPAQIIDKIQVFDRLSDQARFTGFDDANTTKSINIVTKAGMRNGQFGRLYAGYGTDDRYTAGGNMSFFNKDQRISLVGQTNNINQQNFATEDLLGVTSSSNRGGGGARGGGRGGGANRGGQGGGNFSMGQGGSNFVVGQQGGITKTTAFGINYSDKWSNKVDATGSYFFNNTRNASNDQVNREFFLTGDSSQLYDENSLSSSRNNNHRVNLRVEYKMDSANTLLFTPNISFQDNNSLSEVNASNAFKNGAKTSQTINTNSRNTGGYNINNGILYRHSFAKRGRSISMNVNTGFNNRDGEAYLNAINSYYDTSSKNDTLRQFTDQSTKGYTISANVAYTEPIGKNGQLQLNYNPSWRKSNADQQTYLFDGLTDKYSIRDSTLSNKYDNLYTTQNAGISYRVGGRDNSFSAGLAFQNANLSGERIFPMAIHVDRNFNNFLPTLMWRKKISERSRINLNYRTSTNAPTIDQLQDVINNSNPLFLRTGNPDLNQEYSHRVTARYTYTNSLKGQSFFANIFLQQTDDYVANATFIASQDSVISNSVTLYRGSQLTKPVNLDGFRSIRSFLTFSTPAKFIKSNINVNAGYSYAETPGLINNVSNTSKTQNYSFGAVLASNVSEYVDFNLSYTANFNDVKNSIQPNLNNNYFTQNAGIEFNLLSKQGWFVQNSLSNQSYSGLTDGFNQSFWLWNVSAGKKFLKNQNADLRITIFDLLKQNQSISRTATETYIEDVRTQVLQQYFMLTFAYRLRNFVAKK
jgi:hypothetical protein